MEEIEVKIRIFTIDEGQDKAEYVDLINGTEGNIILHTDIDERGIQINIEQLKLALRKITAK